jgi:hypothetical protein
MIVCAAEKPARPPPTTIACCAGKQHAPVAGVHILRQSSNAFVPQNRVELGSVEVIQEQKRSHTDTLSRRSKVAVILKIPFSLF